ncbi:MAG: hypothetical protein FWE03_00590 [Firmicutes bacterium]|nr:hypothetical protein [Bacillota bacterium]
MKRFLSILIVTLAATIFTSEYTFYPPNTEYFNYYNISAVYPYDDELELVRINNSDTPFLHLLSIKNIALSDYYMYILDSNGIHSINFETNETNLISNQSAISIEVYNNQLFILREGGLYFESDRLVPGNFISFAINQENIYLATRQTVFIFGFDGTSRAEAKNISSGNIRQVSVSNFGVFALVSLPQRRFAIYRLDNTTTPQSLNLQNLTSIPYAIYALNDSLLVLTPNSIDRFVFTGGVMVSNLTINVPFDIYQETPVLAMLNNNVYFSSYLDNVYKINLTNNAIDLALASGSNADFFFNRPSGVSYRFGNIIIADTYNNRVSLFNRHSIQHFNITRPISAVMTYTNELIVAYNGNRLLNRETQAALDITYNEYMVVIEKIIADGEYIYIIFEDLMHRQRHIAKTTPLLNEFEFIMQGLIGPISLGQKIGGGISLNEHLIDFFVDYAGNIFGINADGHFVFNNQAHLDLGTFSNITFTTSNASGLAYYNDILLLDKNSHSLFRLSSNLINDISNFYTTPPSSSTLRIARPQSSNAITTTKINTPLFSTPSENNAIIHLPKDTQIMIRREIPSPPNMYYVVAFTTDILNQPLIVCGFIYRAALYSPIPYTPPINASGQIVFDNTHILVFPSINSHSYTTLRRGDLIRVLDFVEYEFNDRVWFRVATSDNTEGFVPARYINTGFMISVLEMTSTNATLRQDAMLLVYLHGVGRVPLELLEAGTRILIATPFDSASRYTRVIVYIDGELAESIEVFIETRYIDFDGVDVWMIVLIVGIVFVVIMLILLAILMKKRKHKIMPYGQYIEDDRTNKQ